jgi:probable F420-dependent oxidoreductase
VTGAAGAPNIPDRGGVPEGGARPPLQAPLGGTRCFRFGFAVAGSGLRSPRGLRERARAAEELGYSIALVPDHLQHQLAPIPTMMYLADATTSLRVGSFVFGNDFRHPGVLARDVLALDLLTAGRLEIGMGAGWVAEDYRLAGVRMDGAGVRIERLEESVRLLKQLLSRPKVDFRGAHYEVLGEATWPECVQRPHPPLLIGGGGRRVLSLAAREADIVSFGPRTLRGRAIDWSSMTAAAMDDRVAWIRDAAGDRFPQLELSSYTAIVPPRITDDARGLASSFMDLIAGRWPEFDLTETEFLDSPLVLIGSVAALVDKLQGIRERFGISYVVVQEGSMAEFAPVVERLAGS